MDYSLLSQPQRQPFFVAAIVVFASAMYRNPRVLNENLGGPATPNHPAVAVTFAALATAIVIRYLIATARRRSGFVRFICLSFVIAILTLMGIAAIGWVGGRPGGASLFMAAVCFGVAVLNWPAETAAASWEHSDDAPSSGLPPYYHPTPYTPPPPPPASTDWLGTPLDSTEQDPLPPLNDRRRF